MSEVVADGISGYLVRPFEATDFNDAIARLLADPALRKGMGEAAREHVRRRHDLQKNYGLVEDVLLELVDKRGVM